MNNTSNNASRVKKYHEKNIHKLSLSLTKEEYKMYESYCKNHNITKVELFRKKLFPILSGIEK